MQAIEPNSVLAITDSYILTPWGKWIHNPGNVDFNDFIDAFRCSKILINPQKVFSYWVKDNYVIVTSITGCSTKITLNHEDIEEFKKWLCHRHKGQLITN